MTDDVTLRKVLNKISKSELKLQLAKFGHLPQTLLNLQVSRRELIEQLCFHFKKHNLNISLACGIQLQYMIKNRRLICWNLHKLDDDKSSLHNISITVFAKKLQHLLKESHGCSAVVISRKNGIWGRIWRKSDAEQAVFFMCSLEKKYCLINKTNYVLIKDSVIKVLEEIVGISPSSTQPPVDVDHIWDGYLPSHSILNDTQLYDVTGDTVTSINAPVHGASFNHSSTNHETSHHETSHHESAIHETSHHESAIHETPHNTVRRVVTRSRKKMSEDGSRKRLFPDLPASPEHSTTIKRIKRSWDENSGLETLTIQTEALIGDDDVIPDLPPDSVMCTRVTFTGPDIARGLRSLSAHNLLNSSAWNSSGHS